MRLKGFMQRNSLISKVCSVVLSTAMVAGMMVGYAPANVGTKAEVQAATTTAPYRNVVYYGEWSIYAGQKNFTPDKIDGSLITHLNFAFMDVDANGDLLTCDYWADVENPNVGYSVGSDSTFAGVLGAMVLLRNQYPNMKIGISVGGWTRSGDFPALAANETTRKHFAENIAKFVHYYGYDFVDIDWEYPTADRDPDPEGNGVTIDKGCKGSEADTKNFTYMLQDIRAELDKYDEIDGKHYELSVAMSASPAMMAKIEYDKVLDTVDFANMMTYDLNGAWNGYTAHQTALYVNDSYDHETQVDGQFSVDTCVKYLENTYGDKIDYSKIVIGVAPYTRGWAGVENDGLDPDNPGLYATAKPNSIIGADGLTTSGTFAYSDIDTLISKYQLKEYYDEKAEAAYYYSAETGYFFTCDNERSVAAKGNYVKEKGLGGLISWMASLDAASAVTQVMKKSLYGDAAIPANEVKMPPMQNVSATVSASGSTYTIDIKNNNTLTESDAAVILNPTGDKASMPYAEKFAETASYPVFYVKTASGGALTGDWSVGGVSSVDGYTRVVPAAYVTKLAPGDTTTINLTTSGTANVSDIISVEMVRRATSTGEEFGRTVVYSNTQGPTDPDETLASGETTAPVGTGTYPEWTIGNNYTSGDLAVYQDKVYKCVIPHTAQVGWEPNGGGATLWEVTNLVNIPETESVETPTEPETTKESEVTTEPETTKESEVPTEPETTKTVEEETTPGIVIDGGVEINGYQISTKATVQGMRTVYSVENTINGKEVVNVGMIYSLSDYATADELYVGSPSKYVRSYNATSIGVCSVNYSGSATATSYAMTMRFSAKTAAEYTAGWRVRAFAQLSDGTYVYSEPAEYTINAIAEALYQNLKMNTFAAHNYLYTDILKVVNPDYIEKDYDWNNELVGI